MTLQDDGPWSGAELLAAAGINPAEYTPNGNGAGPAPPSIEQATDRLRQARADGCDGVGLEMLIQDLAQQTGSHPAALQKILQALDREAEAAAAGDTAAYELVAVRDYEREIQGFEIAGFLPPRIAAALKTVTHGLPYPEPTLAVAYLASVSGVVPLGSEISGLEASDYRVPLNLYLGGGLHRRPEEQAGYSSGHRPYC